MNNPDCVELLKEWGACQQALDWFGNRDPQEAWEQCERADWMLWVAERCGVDQNRMIAIVCDCAELALSCVPADKGRPTKQAIEMMRRWLQGGTSIGKVKEAIDRAKGATYWEDDAARAAYLAVDAAIHAAEATDGKATRHAICTVDYVVSTASHVVPSAAATAVSFVRDHIPWKVLLSQYTSQHNCMVPYLRWT